MKLLLSHGFGNACSWKSSGEKNIWRSMEQTIIPTDQKQILLHQELCVGAVIRCLPERAGGAARELTGRYGNAVSATR